MTTEKDEINPYTDYFELMTNEREANMNRQSYTNMKRDYYNQKGLDPNIIDFDYAFDAGNDQNTDILPKVKKNEDGSVTEDLLLDMNTRDGMAWASASKVYYDAFYNKKDKPRVNPSSIAAMYTAEEKAPKTPEEFAQWGIEHIGWLNYHLPSLGMKAMTLGSKAKTNPEASHAFLHLLNTYGELPMFTWKGTKRFFNGVLQDPSTYVGLGTLGFGLLGKKFAKIGGKGALKATLRAAIDPKAAAVYEGALYGGADDFFRQKVAINAGKDVKGGQAQYDIGRGAVATAFGAVGSAGLIGMAELSKRVAPMAYRAISGMVNEAAVGANERIKERANGTQLFSNPVGPIADEVISRMGAGGGEIPPGRNITDTGFFSKAEEALNNIQQQKGTGRQFLKQLENKFNVKQKELAALGLDKFDNDNKINKEEMIDTIRQNFVTVKENVFKKTSAQEANPDRVGGIIEFNVRDLTSSDNWSMNTDEMASQYSRSGYADDADFLEVMVNRIIPERITFPQTDEPNNLSFETYTANRELLREALKDGADYFVDTSGARNRIIDEVIEHFDDEAANLYLRDPFREGQDTMGLGYSVRYDPNIAKYEVFDDQGMLVRENISTIDEAEIVATNNAYDKGKLLDEVEPDEVKSDEINDPAIKSGTPRYENYKIEGGNKYREYVLENSSFKGDPEASEIEKQMNILTGADMTAKREFEQAAKQMEAYEGLPDSEKELFQQIMPDYMKRFFDGAESMDEVFKRFKTVKETSLDATKKLREFMVGNNLTPNTFDKRNPYNVGPKTHYSAIKNDIGHMRITDRYTEDGKKVMFIEELQSDWSQRGRHNFPIEKNQKRAVERNEVKTQSFKTHDRIKNIIQDVGKNIKKFEDVDFPEYKDALRLSVVNDSAFYDRVGEEGMEVMEKIIDDVTMQDVLNEITFEAGLGSIGESTHLDVFANTLSDVVTDFTLDLNSSPTYPNVLVDFIDQRFAVAFNDALAKKVNNKADRQLLDELDDKAIESNPLLDAGIFTGFGVRMYPERRLNSFVDNLKNDLMDLPTTFKKNFAKFRDERGQKFDKARENYGPIPRGPFVQVSDDIAELQMKTLIRRAIDEGHEFIAIGGPEQQIKMYGEEHRNGMETHYNTVIPKAVNNVLKQFDKKAKAFRTNPNQIGMSYVRKDQMQFGGIPPGQTIEAVEGPMTADENFLTIPITDEMRKSVKQGMSLFELGGTAAGGAAVVGSQMMGQQENEQPGI
tara:strand:+ start:842 stop:4552 length:3711 start_codon:yes stop_codon:yes gene_type:complete